MISVPVRPSTITREKLADPIMQFQRTALNEKHLTRVATLESQVQTLQGELQAQVSSINSAADKMVDAAEKRFAAAVVQSTVQIVGGAISIGSGAASIRAMKTASLDDMKTGSAFLSKQTAQQGILNGSSQVIDFSRRLSPGWARAD